MNIDFKNYKIYLIILALVVIAVVITAIKVSQNNQPNTEITSTPNNINISLENNGVIYHTPLKIKLTPGKTYTIWAFATNYQIYKQDYTIQKGQNKINITLQPETQYLPPEGAPIQ